LPPLAGWVIALSDDGCTGLVLDVEATPDRHVVDVRYRAFRASQNATHRCDRRTAPNAGPTLRRDPGHHWGVTVTISPLDCGSLIAPRSRFEQEAIDEPVELPVPAWLVHHRRVTVLFDTGMHPDLTGPGEFTDTVGLVFDVGLTADQLVDRRLEAAGVSATDIDVVVLSHLHFDHTGGLGLLPDARVVVQRDEWTAGADDNLAAASGFRAAEYRLGHDVTLADGDHDLFGDGLVTCIATPGHTPGHQSLRVRLAHVEVVLAADCAYFTATLDGGLLPPFGHDLAAHAASLDRLRAMRAAGTDVIPGHDRAVFDALPARMV
jgi:glyoxylase-like metal-dependent hydrolase (beta-lactamase superfamily II)